jgi:serine/threonine protein kinase
MMDTSKLIPKGFHFSSQWSHTGVPSAERLTHTTRLAVAPMDYFFIDFGLSSRFASFEERYLDTGMGGQNKKVPELSYDIPYDPFKVDIYQLGGVFAELVEVCSPSSIYSIIAHRHRTIMVLVYSRRLRLP